MSFLGKFSMNRKEIELLVLALPSMLLIFLFSYVPMIGLIIPFKNVLLGNDIFTSKWIGFDNFKFLFNSPDFYLITRNTIGYNLLFIVVGTTVSLLFAIMMFELTKKHVKIYQTIMFFPYFLSWIVVGLIFLGLLDMNYGLLNVVLRSFGIEEVAWYNEPAYWPFILLFTAVWKGAGYSVLIYYTGLLGIDPELYEAAYLDGATKLQRVIYVSIPLLKPLIVLLTIVAVGRIFYSDFGLFFSVPNDSKLLYDVTQTIDVYVYNSLKGAGSIGMSAAAGLYQSICGFILVLVTNSIIRRVDKENSLF